MARIELNEKQKMELSRMMARGMSKGEALIKMGLAVKVEQKVEDLNLKPVKKGRPVDEDKVMLMGVLEEALKGVDGVSVSNVTGREATFTFGGANFTMSLVRHKG